VDAADVAMYEAKRAGGNRTRRAESIEIHSR
jgi:GGDEF domain-containing protein